MASDIGGRSNLPPPAPTRVRSSRAGVVLRDERTQALTAALRTRGDEHWDDLANRLHRCRTAAAARAAWRRETGRPPLRTDLYECRSVACPNCRGQVVRRSQHQAYDRFLHTDAAECSLATVVLARAGGVADVLAAVPRWRATLKRLRKREAQHDAAWQDLTLTGVVEIDAVDTLDLPRLAPSRRALLPCLPVLSAAGDDGVTWVPSLHLAVSHRGLEHVDLARALCNLWPLGRQVDVRPFVREGTGAEQAAHVTGYALKLRQVTTISGASEPWPAAWSAELFGCLHARRDGLRPLRVTLGPMQAAMNIGAASAGTDATSPR